MISELVGLTNTLDTAYQMMQDTAEQSRAVLELALALNQIRQTAELNRWQEIVQVCLEHPLGSLLYQDPLTKRAYTKPRGYAGDAVMIDLLYGHMDVQPLVKAATSTGQTLLETIRTWPSALGVQERCREITRRIDQLALTVTAPHILSIVCGHMRELDTSQGVINNRVGRLVGLDQDAANLSVIAKRYRQVERVNEGVEALFHPDFDLGRFDFVYSTGLYDCLSQRSAQRLTRRLFEHLNPGGTLLIANLRRGLPDVGYMESYMDWTLIYRSAEEIADVSNDIPADQIAQRSVYLGKYGSVFFLEVTAR